MTQPAPDGPSRHRHAHVTAGATQDVVRERGARAHDAAAAWIYRGVWATIVALFRVPPHPPTLPTAGEQVRSIRPSAGYLRYLKFFFWLLLIPGDILPVVGWIAVYIAQPVLALALIPLFAVLIVLPDVVAYIGIHLRYDTTWYVFTDRSLRIRRGIWNIQETTVSFENVQNVEVRQGPLQRHFGIAALVVQTAGGGVAATAHGSSGSGGHLAVLEGLDEADAVRDRILDRIRHLRSGGLGDEPAAAHGADAVSAMLPSHVEVLREIRDVVARMT